MADITISAMIEEVEFELRRRSSAAQSFAKDSHDWKHMERMRAVLGTLRWLHDNRAKIGAKMGKDAAFLPTAGPARLHEKVDADALGPREYPRSRTIEHSSTIQEYIDDAKLRQKELKSYDGGFHGRDRTGGWD